MEWASFFMGHGIPVISVIVEHHGPEYHPLDALFSFLDRAALTVCGLCRVHV